MLKGPGYKSEVKDRYRNESKGDESRSEKGRIPHPHRDLQAAARSLGTPPIS